MSSVFITVVFHPWQTDRDERDRLVAEAASLAPQASVDVLTFTGEAHPAAVAAQVVHRFS